MMNRIEMMKRYFAFLEAEAISACDVTIGAGGAMIMYGLREETQDIDIDIPDSVFDSIRKRGLPEKEIRPGVYLIRYDEVIDLHRKEAFDTTKMLDGVCVSTLESILALKRMLNREKDQVDIDKIEKELAK
jgi:hypothetical protein